MGAYSYQREVKRTKSGKVIPQHVVYDWTMEPPKPKMFKTKRLALGFMKARDQ